MSFYFLPESELDHKPPMRVRRGPWSSSWKQHSYFIETKFGGYWVALCAGRGYGVVAYKTRKRANDIIRKWEPIKQPAHLRWEDDGGPAQSLA